MLLLDNRKLRCTIDYDHYFCIYVSLFPPERFEQISTPPFYSALDITVCCELKGKLLYFKCNFNGQLLQKNWKNLWNTVWTICTEYYEMARWVSKASDLLPNHWLLWRRTRYAPLSEYMYGDIQLRWHNLLYKQLAQNEKKVRNVKYIDTERFVDNHSLLIFVIISLIFSIGLRMRYENHDMVFLNRIPNM